MRLPLKTRPRGQILPLFAIVLPVTLALMGLGLDGAHVFLERREAQGAADLAALAGGDNLPDDSSQAITDAYAIAAANGYPAAEVTVTTPYGGDPNRIEVTIATAVDMAFTPVLGIQTMDVGARAVVEATVASAYGDAIFAYEPDCGSGSLTVLSWGANNVHVTGGVHSNGGIGVSGTNNTGDGGTTHTCSGSSGWSDTSPGTNTWTPPASQTAQEGWPLTYTLADFTCDYDAPADGEWNLGQGEGLAWWVGGKVTGNDPPTLMTGTYCALGANGSIKLDASSVHGEVTFIATQKVDLAGSDWLVTAHENGVLVYSLGTGNEAIKVSGSAGTWEGLMYAPNGTADITGQSSLNLVGGVHAWNVTLKGNSFSVTNGPASAGSPAIALIE